ncbi:Immunoglobulin I-set domain protein [Aphelenchoides bicaudatus]|nr:Immunoglobulin I-set domain protein [Aphelenchoides bicaudatus]
MPKDFIRRLLVPQTIGRMTIHEALDHKWLAHIGRRDDGTPQIPSQRYQNIRDTVRERYDSYPDPNPPIGRVANFSSLRTQRPGEFKIFESLFERTCAAPRFTLKPQSCKVSEGEAHTFFARVISDTLATISWFHRGQELQQGVKHIKRSNGNEYALTITRVQPGDEGDYRVRAQNQYGMADEQAYLQVQRSAPSFALTFTTPSIETPFSRPITPLPSLPEAEEKRSAPYLRFHFGHVLFRRTMAAS